MIYRAERSLGMHSFGSHKPKCSKMYCVCVGSNDAFLRINLLVGVFGVYRGN
jgi:hypothetical protein